MFNQRVCETMQRPLYYLFSLCLMYEIVYAISFENGFDHHYTYSAVTDMLGMNNVTTVIKFRIRHVRKLSPENSLNVLSVDNVVQHTALGAYAENPAGWDFTKRFYFVTEQSGFVTLVYHTEDQDEVLTLKKVLASTFSVNTTVVQDVNKWSFVSKDLDHIGHLEHFYQGEKHEGGFNIYRSHKSVSDVHRHHTKVVRLDHIRTPVHVETFDNITFHRSDPIASTSQQNTSTQTGEVPILSTSARCYLKLTVKKASSTDEGEHDLKNMTSETLVIKKKTPEKKPLHEIKEQIKGNLTCIEFHRAHKNDQLKTDCIHSLRQLVSSLKDGDLRRFGKEVFSKECSPIDKSCIDNREMFIDIFMGKGCAVSQKIILEYVLTSNSTSQEDRIRCFMHCSRITEPIPTMLEYLENECIRTDLQSGDVIPNEVRTACLSLGSIASALDDFNNTEATRIVGKLERFLGHYNESHIENIFGPRVRRSLSEYNTQAVAYMENKVTLIHSIGNAGLRQSVGYLVSYAQPNQGLSRWRKAAVQSLRGYQCTQSATVLEDLMMYDDDDSVRSAAKDVFSNHPLTDKSLYQNSSRSNSVRQRRSIDEEEKLFVLVNKTQEPFDKTFGGKSAGAHVSAYLSGELYLTKGVSSLKFYIDLSTGADVDVLLGIVKFKKNVVHADVCYKGHLEYIVPKDFNKDELQTNVKMYDSEILQTTQPAKLAVTSFRNTLESFQGIGSNTVVQSLISGSEDIPLSYSEAFANISSVVEELDTLNIPASKKPALQSAVMSLKHLTDDSRSAGLDVYMGIIDPVAVDLPYAHTKMIQSYEEISSALKAVIKSPSQAVDKMTRGLSHVRSGLAMFVKTKQHVETALSINKGVTAWLENAKSIQRNTLHFVNLGREAERHLRTKTENLDFNDRIDISDSSVNLVNDLKKLTEKVEPLTSMYTVTQSFMDAFKVFSDLVKRLKKDFMKLKTSIEFCKSRVNLIFGPKLHPDFPRKIRNPDQLCSSGNFPTNTGGHFRTEGIDIETNANTMIVSPVDGIIFTDNTSVIIKPTQDDFKGLELVIENIIPDASLHLKRVPSGMFIGRSKFPNICKTSFIHLSLRNSYTDTEARNSRSRRSGPFDIFQDFSDPSRLLNKIFDDILLGVKWHQECNHYEVRFFGKVTDSGQLCNDLTKYVEKVTRKDSASKCGEDMPGSLNMKTAKKRETARKQNVLRQSTLDEISSYSTALDDVFETSFFSGNGPSIPSFSSFYSLKNSSVENILHVLKDGTSEKKAITDLINRTLTEIAQVPGRNIESVPIKRLRLLQRLTGTANILTDSTSVVQLPDAVMFLYQKECPQFKGSVKGKGIFCIASADCNGITCSVPVITAREVHFILINLTLGSNRKHLYITVAGKTYNITVETKNVAISTDVSYRGLHLSFNIKMDMESVLKLSVEMEACNEILSCVETTPILEDIEFHPAITENAPAKALRRDDVRQMIIQNTPIYYLVFGDVGEHIKPAHKTHDVKRRSDLGDILARSDLGGKLANIITLKLSNSKPLQFLWEMPTLFGPKSIKDIFAGFINSKVEELVKAFTTFECHVRITPPALSILVNLNAFQYFVGPVGLNFHAGFEVKVHLQVKVNVWIFQMRAKINLIPNGKVGVYGSVAIDVLLAEAGLKLTGFVLDSEFDISAEVHFDQGLKPPISFNLQQTGSHFTVELSGYAAVGIPIFRVVIIEKVFVHWTTATKGIKWIDKKIAKGLHRAINLLETKINGGLSKRETNKRGCALAQQRHRRYDDPAYKIEMYAEDSVSYVSFFYAIGTSSGGTDVKTWQQMSGNSVVVPSNLPDGIPLYWTTKAVNSIEDHAISICSLKSYDSTLPKGRVEHAFMYSSHPSKLYATVVVFEDSPLQDNMQFKAVGFCQGQYGNHLTGWQRLSLNGHFERKYAPGNLRYFSQPRAGKLTLAVIGTYKTSTPEECATRCVQNEKLCLSFDYENNSERCEIHDSVSDLSSELKVNGMFEHYERLGSGSHVLIEYDDLELEHGTQYFINAKITNTLGYVGYLTGKGTMIDFTPPEPGVIRNAENDTLQADACNAAITQRCNEVTTMSNHRIILDGPDSETVFSGSEGAIDTLFTLVNHYVTANWKGFHDNESGIWGYTFAVGREVCKDDIVAFEDPFSHLMNKKFWTNSALHKNIHLEDGQYYITVQALNGVELGGSLVTTVCHSTPFTVDTSPPVLNGVSDIIYDEDFDLIAVYFDANDSLSKISMAEFGLGKTKYDVQLKGYSQHTSVERKDPFIAIKELGLQEGIPAWIRVRVTNNVDLFTSGHGKEPILIDRSPPLAGQVLDGMELRQDSMFQSENDRICAQWVDFFDPESGINRFIFGVGTKPLLDDIVTFANVTRYEKSKCAQARLQHNTTYYTTVFAYNNALNSKATNNTSDGVLVDLTPPVPGHVTDGDKGDDLDFTSETVLKSARWSGFHDPESGIREYDVDVYINNEMRRSFKLGNVNEFQESTISMEHLDKVVFEVHGRNGAGVGKSSKSDGLTVDHSPPINDGLSDNPNDATFQSKNNSLSLKWKFHDAESGMEEYRLTVYEHKYGTKAKFWPPHTPQSIIKPVSNFNQDIRKNLTDIDMKDGVTYSMQVSAINKAMLSTTRESRGVTIDTTPPSTPEVHIGHPQDDEELDDEGNVLHNDENGIRVSWFAIDSESRIKSYMVAVGTVDDKECISSFRNYGKESSAYIDNIYLKPTSISNVMYVVSVKAENAAGLMSVQGYSKNIFVQKANVPGVVFDGRERFQDEQYTNDRTSLAASFYGFESESCGIVYYQWAIGTSEYGSDILEFTKYGLVMLNVTHGQCQINTELFEDTEYFITIRAVTGCKDEFIVSSSDGTTVDTTAPTVEFNYAIGNNIAFVSRGEKQVIYQKSSDVLGVTVNVSDKYEIDSSYWSLDPIPLGTGNRDILDNFKPLEGGKANVTDGVSLFLSTYVTDVSGNANRTFSKAIIVDTSPPILHYLTCSKYLSYLKSMLRCSWEMSVERQSELDLFTLSIITNGISSAYALRDHRIQLKRRTFVLDLYNYIKQGITGINVLITVQNVVGLRTTYGEEVTIDHTPPKAEQLIVVTRTGQKKITEHQFCQEASSYIELLLSNAVDEESDIDELRYNLALGKKPYSTDLQQFKPVVKNVNGYFFITDLDLKQGVVFYVTLRIYNKAGLYSDIVSDYVVISVMPEVSVLDGKGDKDIDYISKPNTVEGSWNYSDNCLIREAYWTVSDANNNILMAYQPIISAARYFYNDELNLENGVKYYVQVKTVDHLNRTKVGQSDGFTVRIQPPIPGYVRDGLNEDIGYQHSTTELSANWDTFGDLDAMDPTQIIERYEISIGNDRRYDITRSNIHVSVNVGLNRTYTFYNLNLTAKLVRYYITVRAYSKSGSFSETTSNGVRVGFAENITPGVIVVNAFQSSTNMIAISLGGFYSDLGIRKYSVAVSSHSDFITNDTRECELFVRNQSMFDVADLRQVNLNEYVKLDHLFLQHNASYYVTVLAHDEAGMCIAVTASPILVDTTPPVVDGIIAVNGVENNDIYFATDKKELHFSWRGFSDPESGIKSFEGKLFQCQNCEISRTPSENCSVISSKTLGKNSNASFYDLEISSVFTYVLELYITNQALQTVSVLSPPIKLDLTAPFRGNVYISDDWSKPKSFQHSNTNITGFLALAFTENDYICPNEIALFPVSDRGVWRVPQYNFSEDFLRYERNTAHLGLGYNSDLTKITKSGIINDPFVLNSGNYAFVLKAGYGNKVVTTIAAVTETEIIPFKLNDKPIESNFDEKYQNPNMSEHVYHGGNTTSNGQKQRRFDENYSDQTLSLDGYGFGIHILGYKIENNTKCAHVFWAVNKFTCTKVWFDLDIDPTENELSYGISIHKYHRDTHDYVDLSLIINESEIASIRGFQFGSVALKPAVLTWTENGFKPPLTNIYLPFYTETILRSLKIPTSDSKACLHGKGFYDPESSIKEIWMRVNSPGHSEGNIYPMQLYRTFCFKGTEDCARSEDTKCDRTNDDTFQLIHLSVSGLQLDVLDNTTILCMNQTSDLHTCNISSYFLSVKVVNFAGLSRVVHSNPVQIDQTPPTFVYVKCLDPTHSGDEPTDHLGSSSDIGAYWKCIEDISQIDYYAVSVVQVSPEQNIMNRTEVGLKRRARFSFGDTTFKHGKEYRITVEAVNTAGLKAFDSCLVLVDLLPPTVDSVALGPLFTDTEDSDGTSEDIPSVTSSQTKIGLTWSGGNNDTRFYQWQVGSGGDKDDLFPRYALSNAQTGSVAIVSGRLEIGGAKQSVMKVGEFLDTENMTYGETGGKRNGSDIDKSFFMLEPGRCVYQSLYAVGWSHLSQKVKSRPVCVRRPADLYIKNGSAAAIIASKVKGSNKWIYGDSDARRNDVVIQSRVISGRIMFGTITRDDKTASYGSAASAEYSTYIADPELTAARTSRFLRNRIERFCELSFFVSPVPNAHLEHLHLNVSLTKECNADENYQPGLVYWNYETMEWEHIDEGCQGSVSSKVIGDIYSSELCLLNRKLHTRDKRASQTLFSHPRNFQLARIGSHVENKKPEIVTSSINVREDKFVPTTITIFDQENDTVLYEITKQPSHSICTIGGIGDLNCDLEPNFYGGDEFTIRVTETNVPVTVSAHTIEKTIKLNISPEEDATERAFIDNKGILFRNKRPALIHAISVEANRSDTLFVGTIILSDVDGNETFTEKLSFHPLGNSTFHLNDSIDETRIPNKKLLPTPFRSVKTYGVTFEFSPVLNGNMSLNFIAISANGIYTPSVTVNLYILANPCVNGRCNHVNGHHVCDSLERASSFDDYFCSCNAGFSGTWCQIDINECGPEPCALMYDCEDLINDYRCNINIPKLVAILGCSVFAVIGFLLILRRICKKYRRNKVSISRTQLTVRGIEMTKDFDSRPLSSRSIQLETDKCETPNILRNTNPNDNQNEVDTSALVSHIEMVGRFLPPHHQPAQKRKLNAWSSQMKTSKMSNARPDKSNAGLSYEKSSLTNVDC